MKIRMGGFALVLIVGAVVLSACSDDDVVAPKDDPVPIVEPVTEDQVMSNFRTAYEDMDSGLLLSLLHPDFELLLQASTIEQFPNLGPTLDHAEETRSAQRMFSGEPVTNSAGDVIAAVSSISFNILEQQGTWMTNGPTDPFPNARSALFDVQFLFDRAGNSTLPVQGQIKFHLSHRDTVINGQTKIYFTMIGQQDLTNSGKMGVEATSWGSIKALYW
jgi:hypothetical protein